MNPIEKQERKRQAWRRLRAQRRRAGQLRGRVVAISLIGFALLWAAVFVQMATGNDPVLSAKSPQVASSRPARSAARQNEAETVEPEPVETEPVEAEAPEVEVVEAEPEPAPVTTSQS
jgi:hypothetical protein